MNTVNPIRLLFLGLLLLLWAKAASAQQAPENTTAHCAEWQQHTLQRLHSQQSVDLCALMAGKPVLIINTASHCGFTGQFRGLEALHKEYADQGLVVLGVPSNSFRQEAASEAETASVCYKNYGVTFTMTEVVGVKGPTAHPLFRYLASSKGEPRWNFTKYLIDAEGEVVAMFPSHIGPNDDALRSQVKALL